PQLSVASWPLASRRLKSVRIRAAVRRRWGSVSVKASELQLPRLTAWAPPISGAPHRLARTASEHGGPAPRADSLLRWHLQGTSPGSCCLPEACQPQRQSRPGRIPVNSWRLAALATVGARTAGGRAL